MSELNISTSVMEMIFSAVEEGIQSLKVGQGLAPFVLLLTKGGVVLQRFSDEDVSIAIEQAQKAVADTDENTLAYAIVYDGQLEIEGKDIDALMVEAGEHDLETGWHFVQRYQAKIGENPLSTIGNLAYLGTGKNHLTGE